jgi:hypothetical protein
MERTGEEKGKVVGGELWRFMVVAALCVHRENSSVVQTFFEASVSRLSLLTLQWYHRADR